MSEIKILNLLKEEREAFERRRDTYRMNMMLSFTDHKDHNARIHRHSYLIMCEAVNVLNSVIVKVDGLLPEQKEKTND